MELTLLATDPIERERKKRVIHVSPLSPPISSRLKALAASLILIFERKTDSQQSNQVQPRTVKKTYTES